MIEINSTEISQPTSVTWQPRAILGRTVGGRNVYSATRSIQLKWDVMPMSEYSILVFYANLCEAGGRVTVLLPDIRQTVFQYSAFTNCIIDQPTCSNYFNEEYVTDITLDIQGIDGTL